MTTSTAYRPSRFIEGEPLNYAPPVAVQPLFNSIMTEQEEYDQRLRRRRESDQSSSVSPTGSTGSREMLPRRSTSSLIRDMASGGRTSAEQERGREKDRSQSVVQTTSEKIKGRLRALTTGKSSGEARSQTKIVAN